MKHWVLVLALVFIVALLAASSAKAQTSKDGPMAKLTHSLVLLHEQHAARLAQRSTAPFSSDDPLVTLVNDRVVIDAVASGDVNVLKSDLVALGMQQAVAFGRVVSGQLTISAIPAAARLASLRFAQSAAATTHVGNVTSQGDRAMRADVARSTFGLTGSGVSVGVLSSSFGRVGCEGRISVLKRRHGLRKCHYRGMDGMDRWVGWAVIADNLIHIDKLLPTEG